MLAIIATLHGPAGVYLVTRTYSTPLGENSPKNYRDALDAFLDYVGEHCAFRSEVLRVEITWIENAHKPPQG